MKKESRILLIKRLVGEVLTDPAILLKATQDEITSLKDFLEGKVSLSGATQTIQQIKSKL